MGETRLRPQSSAEPSGAARSGLRGRAGATLALLLVAVAAQYTWNSLVETPLYGYDAGGHAGYALAIKAEASLPHPLSGWSSFHPPTYYVLAAGVWSLLEPLGPSAIVAGLRGLGALAMLAAGAVAFQLALRRSGSIPVAATAAALVMLVPASQLAATMVGNEALAAGFAALALPAILSLQSDPRRPTTAFRAGLLAGLALATKYSGIWVAAACAVPFLRRDLDRAGARALALCLVTGAVVAAPVYVRNVVLTGSPTPMTRELEPMRTIEARMVLRPRAVADYLSMPAQCWTEPSVVARSTRPDRILFNPHMTSVPCLTYASTWYDPFRVRIPTPPPASAAHWGFALMLLGLCPTALVLYGFGRCLIDALRSRGRSAEAPLVLMSLLGVTSFAVFTWRAPSLAAVKGSYLLPLVVPAAIYFARACDEMPRQVRAVAVALSLTAALTAGSVFTSRWTFPRKDPMGPQVMWSAIGRYLPESHIAEAVRLLVR
jgi:hypothetical protein